MSLGVWRGLARDEEAELVEDAEAHASVAVEAVLARLRERLRILDRFGRDIEGATAREEWESDAAETVADHPDIHAMARLDEADHVVWEVPAGAVGGLAAGAPLGTAPLRTVRIAGAAGVLARRPLYGGGAAAMLLDVPALVDLVGVSEDFDLEVREAGVPIHRVREREREEHCGTSPLELEGLAWEIVVCPTRAHAAVLRTPLPEVVLAAGVALSLLLGRLLRLERLARARAAEAEYAIRELGGFAYAVAHDFRSPIRALDAYSRIILEEHAHGEGPLAGYATRISTNARQIGALVDGILELAKIARADVRIARVDVSSVAREALGRLREAEPDRHVEVAVADGLEVEGDAGLLAIAVHQLLDNAWKFTRGTAGARVEVGRQRVDGVDTLYVRDNGPGFSMEHAGELFRPFQRLNVVPELEGRGLGLALAEKAIARMGGRLWASSAPGEGATFWFTTGR
ncbi:MAG: sensor histidine kinase [Myxococcota bacterium]